MSLQNEVKAVTWWRWRWGWTWWVWVVERVALWQELVARQGQRILEITAACVVGLASVLLVDGNILVEIRPLLSSSTVALWQAVN